MSYNPAPQNPEFDHSANHQTVQDFIDLYEKTYHVLTSQQDLSPRNVRVNSCLTDFVAAVMDWENKGQAEQILSDKKVAESRPRLLEALSEAEFQMEAYFARDFLDRDSLALEDLEDFWYRDCYKNLTSAELTALNEAGVHLDENSSVTFIGSGPMPLTALDFYLQTGASVTCVDNDPQAIAQSGQMIRKLGLEDKIDFICADGADIDTFGSDLVFIASLVTGKDSMLQKIRTTSPQAVVGVRSVEDLNVLLYDPVDPKEVTKFDYEYIAKSAAEADTINTTLFFASHDSLRGPG